MRISTLLASAAMMAFASTTVAAQTEVVNLMENANSNKGWKAYQCVPTIADGNVSFGETTQVGTNIQTGISNVTVYYPVAEAGTLEGSTVYEGNLLRIRQDNLNNNPNIPAVWQLFEVNLEAGNYDFSMLYGIWFSGGNPESNPRYTDVTIAHGNNPNAGVIVALVKSTDIATWSWDKEKQQAPVDVKAYGKVSTIEEIGLPVTNAQLFGFTKIKENGWTPNGSCPLEEIKETFTVTEAGKYYVAFNFGRGIFETANYSLTKNTTTGIADVDADAAPVATKYYSIDGRELTSLTQGSLVIEHTVYNNGQVKASKKVIR